MPALLFVCTANICRSPMAASLMKAKLANLENKNPGSVGAWRVESAGTWGLDGSDMADSVKVVLKERGITPETHAARTVNAEMLNAFDLILTMEKGQQEALRIEFPEVAERVYLLSEMIGERFNINDPIGQSLTEFRNTARNIATILDEGFEKIKQLTGGRNDL